MRVAVFLLILLFVNTSYAQDSSFNDLGRVQIRKNFSQTMTIKGKDLERIVATSLHEAISVWLYGTLTNVGTVVFVVDGHMVSDVNIYNIRDIEEITLIQNAATEVSGAFWQQQMVLIETKKKKTEGWHVSAAGLSAIITKKVHYPSTHKTVKSDNSFFHDYLVSVTRRTQNINAGVSIGFTRDVAVMRDSLIIKQKPNNLQRYRLNTYLDWTINKHHELSARANLARQPNSLYYVQQWGINGSITYDRNGKDKMANTELNLRSKWDHGLTNSLSIAYTGLGFDDSIRYTVVFPNPTSFTQSHYWEKTRNLLLTNTLRWTVQTRNLTLSPALNISHRYLKEHIESNSVNGQQFSQFLQKNKGQKWLVTPSFDFLYKEAINLQAGVVTDLSRLRNHRWSPYATLSASMNQLAGVNGPVKLQLFASYAKAGYFLDHVYWLRQFAIDGTTEVINNNAYGNQVTYNPPLDSNFINWQLGTKLTFFNDRLILSYNFEKRSFIGPTAVTTWMGQALIYIKTKSATHDIRAELKIFNGNSFNWFSGIHFTSVKNKVPLPYTMSPWDVTYYQMGDANDAKRSWSSGWNNRIQYKNLLFGLDVLYHFSKTGWVKKVPSPVEDNFNLLSIYSAYLGYHLTLQKNKELELYVSLRNPYQNEDYMRFMDTRSYYGAGFRLAL